MTPPDHSESRITTDESKRQNCAQDSDAAANTYVHRECGEINKLLPQMDAAP